MHETAEKSCSFFFFFIFDLAMVLSFCYIDLQRTRSKRVLFNDFLYRCVTVHYELERSQSVLFCTLISEAHGGVLAWRFFVLSSFFVLRELVEEGANGNGIWNMHRAGFSLSFFVLLHLCVNQCAGFGSADTLGMGYP